MTLASAVAPTSGSEAVLRRAEANLIESRRVGFERLVIARDWALAHVGDAETVVAHSRHFVALGAGRRAVSAYAAAELGVALEVSTLTARRLMEDGLDLADRMPSVWAAMAAGGLEAWVGRKIADLTRPLTDEQATRVDAQVADVVASLPTGRLLGLVEGRVVEADQDAADRRAAQAATERGVWLGRKTTDGADGAAGTRMLFARGAEADIVRVHGTVDHLAHVLRQGCPELVGESMDQLRARALGLLGNPLAALKLLIGAEEHDEHTVPDVVAQAITQAPAAKTRPRTVLYLHTGPETLAGTGVARAEQLGALTRTQLIDLLGHEHVTLKPVIDLCEYAGGIAADCYEVPAAMSEALHLARPGDCFPTGGSLSRRQDQDHTVPYPRGQTRLDNLGHLTRHHHRVKTHAGWTLTQERGRFTWTSPHGRVYLTDRRGTHRRQPRTPKIEFGFAVAA